MITSTQALEFFGLTAQSSVDDLERAYRGRVTKVHPDHGGSVDEFKTTQEHYEKALATLQGERGPLRSFIDVLEPIDAMLSAGPSDRTVTDPETAFPPPRVCRHCGRHDGSSHYYTSPDCWAKHQEAVKAKYEDFEQELLAKKATGERFWPNPIRRIPCWSCGRIMFRYQGDRATKCPYCVKETIRINRKRSVPPATCQNCHHEFQPKRSDAKYCSPRCRQQAYRDRVTAN